MLPELKYNFVFFGASYDFLRPILGEELYHSEYVRICKEYISDDCFLGKLHHYHWACRSNQYFDLPFKSLWYKKMYENHFLHPELPTCFVYLGGQCLLHAQEWTEYVRKRNPRNRQVIWHLDRLDKSGTLDPQRLHSMVDLAMTYDEFEAKKYGIQYCPQNWYSKLIPEPETSEILYDAYLLAFVKDRLPKIMAVYHKLTDNGVRCRFLLAGVPLDEQKPYPGIEYTAGISYKENLENLCHSKCVIELIQGGTNVPTLRAKEAIAYRRRLLTNASFVNPEHFHDGQFQLFSNPEDIDCEFFKRDFNPDDYPPRVDLNPMNRLYDIQERLEKLGK